MSRLRTTAAAATLPLALPPSLAAAAPALAAPPVNSATSSTAQATQTIQATSLVELPRPTGPFAVGEEVLNLVDQNRPDPWVPSAGPRQLMVSMYYPAHAETGTPAPYMTPAAARALLDGKPAGNTFPTEAVSGARTWAESGARPQGSHYPLVVLSPGFTMPRATLSGLAEDLTSHGYVVAVIDHTYENTGTTFPDGRTLPCEACGKVDGSDDKASALLEAGREKDVSFVIDQLTNRPHPAWRYARLIDRDRIGMAGHSAGGASTVPALLTDDRIRAGVNLDGTMHYRVPESGLKGKPFMMIGHPLDNGRQDSTWVTSFARLDGGKRLLTVDGSDHGSFTDLPVFFDGLGIPKGPHTTIDGRRAVAVTRQYVGAFFDLQLKGIPQPLLDGPSAAYPEVRFTP
ncbi:alpha/beta hydrolase family protein [Kitasatospora sp. NPDC056651]|uniref:alpha/beta hydrolase family protein n=1 Tax=Kitasatospora sp. NPDC056651 TaxID=3345892 RepID=UPI0036A1C6FC